MIECQELLRFHITVKGILGMNIFEKYDLFPNKTPDPPPQYQLCVVVGSISHHIILSLIHMSISIIVALG